MYSFTHISILNGTEVAGTFSDFHSVRQGCPLSMHLFVIYIEPLLSRLFTVLNGINLFGTNVGTLSEPWLMVSLFFLSSRYEVNN
jgi:hypothetical protein